MFKYMLILLTSVVLASVSQILLKKSASIQRENKVSEYLNCLVVVAYIILFISTLLTMCAYKQLQLSQGMILESTSYILIPILGYFIFKEKLNKKKVIGISTIILGIFIFSIFG